MGARFAVRGADGPAARSAAFRKESPFYLNFIFKNRSTCALDRSLRLAAATDEAKQTVLLATVVQTVGVPLRALSGYSRCSETNGSFGYGCTKVQTVGVSLGSAVLLDYCKKAVGVPLVLV